MKRKLKRRKLKGIFHTRDGRRITELIKDNGWLRGKIGTRKFLWWYTGNYIGGDEPHVLDIDWGRKFVEK